jgi:hypothetical protein
MLCVFSFEFTRRFVISFWNRCISGAFDKFFPINIFKIVGDFFNKNIIFEIEGKDERA